MFLIFPDLKDDLEKLLQRVEKGQTGFLFGPRISPLNGQREFHPGLDIPKPLGTPIHLPYSGYILKAWDDEIYHGGNSIVSRHPQSFIAINSCGFCHMKEFSEETIENVTENDGLKDPLKAIMLPAGTVIGFVDSTGGSSGNHLHFAVRQIVNHELQYIDPLPFLLEAVGIDVPWHKVG